MTNKQMGQIYADMKHSSSNFYFSSSVKIKITGLFLKCTDFATYLPTFIQYIYISMQLHCITYSIRQDIDTTIRNRCGFKGQVLISKNVNFKRFMFSPDPHFTPKPFIAIYSHKFISCIKTSFT